MEKMRYKRVKGSKNLRQRLLLATLSATPILVEDIHADQTIPGLRPHELSLLHLIEKVSDDYLLEINETGTRFKYKPGIVTGGKDLVYDCGVSRSIGYFMEPLIILGLFSKEPLTITLKGITNDQKDPCVDTFRSTTLPMLKRFGVPQEGLSLKIESRGSPPHGGGEVVLSIPIVQNLTAVNWIDQGYVKRIRGITYSTNVSSQFENTMIHAARGIFNNLLADVHIETDHRGRRQAGNSPGYGISLVAETRSGCFISAHTAIYHARGDEVEDDEEKKKKELLMPAKEVGEQVASLLLQEIEQGGVVDSTHQGLLFLLCALCPTDVSTVRVGKLSPYGIETLREIYEMLGVQFVIRPDPETGTVILTCVGCGLNNLSRKIS